MCKRNFTRLLLSINVMICSIQSLISSPDGVGMLSNIIIVSNKLSYNVVIELQTDSLKFLNNSFQSLLSLKDTANERIVISKIVKSINKVKNVNEGNLDLSNSMYFVGHYYATRGIFTEAHHWLVESQTIRERLNCFDSIYSNCLYNLSVAYFNLGDFKKMELITLKCVDKLIHEAPSLILFKCYSNLVTAYFGLNEYSKAISFGNKALEVFDKLGKINNLELIILYTNMGICHSRVSNYTNALINLNKAEELYTYYNYAKDERYVNLLNTLASIYYWIGEKEKSELYFNRGIELVNSPKSVLSLNFIANFANILGNTGQVEKGYKLIGSSLSKARGLYGENSINYIEMLKNYAEYLRSFGIDNSQSIKLYERCLKYLRDPNKHTWLREPVLIGYALAISKTCEPERALPIIQGVLFSGLNLPQPNNLLLNPSKELIPSDLRTIDILKAKYQILWKIYSHNNEFNYLASASQISELVVVLIEKLRNYLKEEDSVLALGANSRDNYLCAIRDFELCYRNTGDRIYLKKSFVYGEKSKVAGLLTAIRKMKATQLHIPDKIADLEMRLNNEIIYFNQKVVEEEQNELPNKEKITNYRKNIFDLTNGRDSLTYALEEAFPEYFKYKYNTNAINTDEIVNLIGHDANYINYVIGDTVMYIFVSNKSYTQLVPVKIDSSFFREASVFRSLIMTPFFNENGFNDFNKFIESGTFLYSKVFDPIRKYLISDDLVISPDNILSFIPFDVIPSMSVPADEVLFKGIPYLFVDYKISYIYSATFLAESIKRNKSLTNKILAISPSYTDTNYSDPLKTSISLFNMDLKNIPYAWEEAKFAVDLIGGKLLLKNKALESVFKKEVSKFDIIHLAAHTTINKDYPMQSKMIFSPEKDNNEDGLLNTYEICSLPIKAKMIVLNSCETGIGKLQSGEGILNLARGFMYSGSQAIVMSLWNIEDRSGNEIIKMFYKNLKKGYSKSNALRNARMKYLEKADLLRSHPFFWGSLIIYGNDSPIYYQNCIIWIIGLTLCLVLFGFFLYFYWSR